MRRSQLVRTFLTLAILVGFSSGWKAQSQTTVPKEAIPSDISAELREEIQALYSSDLVTRANAARHLGRMGEEAAPAVPFLIGMLADTQHDVVRTSMGFNLIVMSGQEASNALARIGPPAIEGLRAALEHQDSQVRFMSARALGKMGNAAGLETLVAALKSGEPELREAAVRGLGESGEAAALEHLRAALGDKQASVRKRAVGYLGEKKDAQATELLIGLLEKEKDPEMRQALSDALKKITGQELGEDAAQWKQWWAKQTAEQE